MAKAKKPMTKAQLMAHLADATDTPKKTVAAIFEKVLEVAYSEAKKDHGFQLPGLGKLVVVKTKARTGRHPKTGEPIQIPAKQRLKFRIAKQAKDAIVGAQKAATKAPAKKGKK